MRSDERGAEVRFCLDWRGRAVRMVRGSRRQVA